MLGMEKVGCVVGMVLGSGCSVGVGAVIMFVSALVLGGAECD